MNLVLDTNILVSAAWSPTRNAAHILESAFSGHFIICYDDRILAEYERVLHYPKLHFSDREIRGILDPLIKCGIPVIAPPLLDASFERDESDRKFYEVAVFCRALLITGNLAHYPMDDFILSPAAFCERYL